MSRAEERWMGILAMIGAVALIGAAIYTVVRLIDHVRIV